MILYELISDTISSYSPSLNTIYHMIIYFNINEFEIYKGNTHLINEDSILKDVDKLYKKKILNDKERLDLYMIVNHNQYNTL